MNRRSFLSLLSAAGVSVTLSPLLATPAQFLAPTKKLTRTVGPVVEIKPYDVSTQFFGDSLETGQFTLTMPNRETFVFQIRPRATPKECAPMKRKTGIVAKGITFPDYDVIRVVSGGPIEIEEFRLSFCISRSDGNYQGTLSQVPHILPPPQIEASWREVSYA